MIKLFWREPLAKGETLYLTIFFPASNGAFEHGLVEITSWNSTIHGVVSSDLILLEEPKAGDQVTFQEDVVLDWTTTKPDGSEEGNLVGKFLDSYNPQ